MAITGLKRAGHRVGGRVRHPVRGAPSGPATAGSARGALGPPDSATVDLQRRRDQLNARVAELQWDLGGLAYEMAVRDRIQVDLLVRRAAVLQNADAELNEVERILKLEQSATAGECGSCGAPHSSGAAYCWQCGQPLLQELSSDEIGPSAPTDRQVGPAPSAEQSGSAVG